MKKFSNITNQKIGSEPKEEQKLNEEQHLKNDIMNLMEQFLCIRTYGPVDRYQRAGLIQISGKEIFLEALMNLFKISSIKEKTKLLESLRGEFKDWQLLDNKLDQFTNESNNHSVNTQVIIQKNNLLKSFENLGKDEEMFLKKIEESCKKIKNYDSASIRSISAKLLYTESNREIFKLVSEKFELKAKQLRNIQ